jgi:hypothetical protein
MLHPQAAVIVLVYVPNAPSLTRPVVAGGRIRRAESYKCEGWRKVYNGCFWPSLCEMRIVFMSTPSRQRTFTLSLPGK